MANINIENISDLNLNGNDLFEDSENFMTELSDDSEQANIIGGQGSRPCVLATRGGPRPGGPRPGGTGRP